MTYRDALIGGRRVFIAGKVSRHMALGPITLSVWAVWVLPSYVTTISAISLALDLFLESKQLLLTLIR